MEITGPTVFSRCTRTEDDFKETTWRRVWRSRTARPIQLPVWYRIGWLYRLPFPLQAHFTSRISILIGKRSSSTYKSNVCSNDSSPAYRCITSSTGRQCSRVRRSAVAFRSRQKQNGGTLVKSAAACLPQIFQLQHILCLQARSVSLRLWRRRPFRHRRPLRLLSRFLRSSGN